MGKMLKVNLFKNKNNRQISFSIPKKRLSKKLLDRLIDSKRIKISIEELYND